VIDKAGEKVKAKVQNGAAQMELGLCSGEKGKPLPASEELGLPRRESGPKIVPEQLGWEQIRAKRPVFYRLTDADRADPAQLGKILTRDARISGGAKRKETLTYRATVLQDKRTSKVYLVGTYPHGRAGAMLVNPLLESKRPHRRLVSILADYRPLFSVLMPYPTKGLRAAFDSLEDFNAAVGERAALLANGKVIGRDLTDCCHNKNSVMLAPWNGTR
jgi:hypothetical protein